MLLRYLRLRPCMSSQKKVLSIVEHQAVEGDMACLRRKRAARKGRACCQGTMPLSTPLATILTGLSCIWAKAVATWRYMGSRAASLALMLPSMAGPPSACTHSMHFFHHSFFHPFIHSSVHLFSYLSCLCMHAPIHPITTHPLAD